MKRCPHRFRHWFTIHGQVGLRSPVCTECGEANPRKLNSDEWEELLYFVRMAGSVGPFVRKAIEERNSE